MTTPDPSSFLRLRAACTALDAIEEARIHVSNVLGVDRDGTPIPSRVAHVFEPVAMFIADPDERRKVKVNMSALAGLQMAEDAARRVVVETLASTAPRRLLEWAKAEPGVGDITLGRLLGEIGHPRIYQPMTWIENPDWDSDKPSTAENPKRLCVPNGDPKLRTVAMLWQYSRVGDALTHPRHFKALEVEPTQAALLAAGSPRVRTRLFVVTDTIVRQSFRFRSDREATSDDQARIIRDVAELVKSPPRKVGPVLNPKDPYAHLPLAAVYLVRKAITEGRCHTQPCARCRTSDPDAPWGAGHRDADARRFVAKQFLKRVWQQSDEAA